jgi:hypothetical protein
MPTLSPVPDGMIRRVKPGGDTTTKAESPAWAGIAWALLPPLLASVLAIPCLRFTFLYDDYDFLLRARSFGPAQLVPDPTLPFYRPLSREVYFAFLGLFGRTNPFWGHLGNMVCVAASAALLADLTRRLAGARAGLIAGLLYASLSSFPFLVGWVSCSQDVFAGLFSLIALRLELGRRSWPAALACGAAILSKETAILLVPIVAALPWLLRRDLSGLRGNLFRYGAVALIWAAVHPKMRGLIQGGVVTGEGGYLGVDNPKIGENLLGLVAGLLNLPLGGPSTPWPSWLTPALIAGLALIGLGYGVLPKRPSNEELPFPRERITAVGIALLVLPGIPTVVFVKHWATYFAFIPAMGTSILFSLALATRDRKAIVGTMAVFLTLGVWARGVDTGRRFSLYEANFRSVSNHLVHIADGLKMLHPAFAESTRLYVTLQTRDRRLEGNLLRLHAPRVWYDDPSIRAEPLEGFDPRRVPSALFWIDGRADVFELEYPSLQPRSNGQIIQNADYQKAIRSVALGLARAGYVDDAARAILTMRATSAIQVSFDRRFVATLYLEAGRAEDAARVVAGLPPMDRTEALYALSAALGAWDPSEAFDRAAFVAFGVSPDDTEAWRYLMKWYVSTDQYDAAHRMALHLRSLMPSDEEAGAMIQAMRDKPDWEPVLPVTR